MISPLAYVHPEAQIGKDCEIGPFCYIDKDVVIGERNTLMNSVTLLSGTRMGDDNTVFPGAVIGAIPQDLKFKGEYTTAEIGSRNKIRENVTINRGTAAKGKTVVGSDNLLMEGCHVAHDVIVGNGCIIGNTTKLAGEVVVDDFAILSACVLVHQFCHVGSYVMVGGGSRTAQDIPPFVMAAREPIAYCGLNVVGLRRRQFAPETIEHIHNAYRILYQHGKLLADRLKEIEQNVPMIPEVKYILDFVSSSQRGFIN
ncbi:MAG: acyl-ACP--UDP-N-acetylglucosamine O-acyltransferase [Bacteroidales bacterium]|nr:acyl-ACP--UDP-N-acetylglucosamine O-acyltransferase [Candidatus Equimonas enterica]